MMTAADIAALLAQARAEARVVHIDDLAGLIGSVEDAYRVQSELAALPGGSISGWKVTALKPEDQRKYLATGPVAGPLFAPYVDMSPAKLSLSRLIAPVFECEVAFILGADLPSRSTPYDRSEVEAAVEAVVAAFEIPDGRVEPGLTELVTLADAMGNGAFIVGTPVSRWRDLDLGNIAITLTADNGENLVGNSSRILGNPFLALLALANAQPLADGGLKKGQIVTTGTCTTPVPVRAGTYVGEFGPLGRVRVSFAD
jgi:2-keto-4-pentenoate hydratase